MSSKQGNKEFYKGSFRVFPLPRVRPFPPFSCSLLTRFDAQELVRSLVSVLNGKDDMAAGQRRLISSCPSACERL